MAEKKKRKVTKKTIKPGKDIVASVAGELKPKMLKAIEQGIVDLTIDLKGVEMVDSVGLGVIIAAHNSIDAAGGKICITNVSENICKLFRTMRLDQHFEVICEE